MTARRRIAIAALVLTAPLVSSCGISFGAQTNKVYNPAAGVDNRSGSVDVLNALVVSGTDGSGAFVASLVNNDQTHADALTGLSGAGKDAALKATVGGTTKIAANGLLNMAVSSSVAVRDERVVPGNFVRVTLTFDRGQPITVNAPVVSADDPQYAEITLPAAS